MCLATHFTESAACPGRDDPRLAARCYSRSMKTRIALLLTLVAAPLYAETLMVGDQMQVKPPGVEVPAHGIRMAQVEAKFGAPREKHAAVGKPPITRWDYDSFSVYFERDYVIHSVIPGAPPVLAAPAPAGSGN